MKADEIRGDTWDDVSIQVEIAAQLAELNEKFSDYFQTLEPESTDNKRGIR